jgi:hypothetical protein
MRTERDNTVSTIISITPILKHEQISATLQALVSIFCYKRRPPAGNAIEKMVYFSNRLMKSPTRNDVNKQNLAVGAKTTLLVLSPIVRGQ